MSFMWIKLSANTFTRRKPKANVSTCALWPRSSVNRPLALCYGWSSEPPNTGTTNHQLTACWCHITALQVWGGGRPDLDGGTVAHESHHSWFNRSKTTRKHPSWISTVLQNKRLMFLKRVLARVTRFFRSPNWDTFPSNLLMVKKKMVCRKICSTYKTIGKSFVLYQQ